MRVGLGYDIHRLIPAKANGSIPLGGLRVPCSFHIEAHSDGDVLLHAIVDACLGALALGDIGTWFSDKKEENRGRNSRDFALIIRKELAERGWRVAQCDSNVIAEEPKIGPHRDEIRKSIAGLFEIDLEHVSVKAKTMEGLGEIGKGQAIAAEAIVLLLPLR